MKFAFILLSLALLILPLLFHFDKKVFNDGNFKTALGASLIATIVLSIIQLLQGWLGLLIYASNYTIGLFIKEVPLEQYLLNFTFSFTAIALYQYLNIKFTKNDLQRYSLALSNLLLGLCVAFFFFAYNKWYTLSTFATLFILLFFIEYVGKIRFMYKAYRAFMIMLVPFYLVYGFLFWKGIIAIDKNALSGMYVFRTPVESHCASLALILLSIYMFEFFRGKRTV